MFDVVDRAMRVASHGDINDPSYLAMVMLSSDADYNAVLELHDSPDFGFVIDTAIDMAEDINHGIDMADLATQLAA